jgi:glycosyltransferase involved in cell wall biosynthesis
LGDFVWYAIRIPEAHDEVRRDLSGPGMTDSPDVSVVISTFNRASSLAITLDSLQSQFLHDDLDYEVIVVDNNSTDGTRTLVEGLIAGGFSRLRYIFEARQGVSFGRNTGIAAARAPVIAFTDDDNDVGRTWIATIKASFDAHPDVDVLGGPILPRWPSTPPAWLDRRHWSPVAIVDYGTQPFRSTATRPVCFLTANLAVRGRVFERIGGFSPEFPRGQDHEFLLRFWCSGGHALYVPSLLASAGVQPERLTRRYHRRWHQRHGAIAAAMRLQERIGHGGALLDEPVRGREFFGLPGYVCSELAREMRALIWSWLAVEDASQRLHHSHRVSYLAGYLRARVTNRIASWRWRAAVARMPLPPARYVMVLLLMAAVVGGSLFDIVEDREDWPLSQYPMFSTVDAEPVLRVVRLMGVTREAPPREIALLDDDFIAPLDQCRLSTGLARTFGNPSRRGLGPAMMRGVLERYELRRINGAHSGPPLSAVRAYDMTWMLEPDAGNVDRPDEKRLLAEVGR